MWLAVSFQQLIPNVFHKDATKALLKIFADVSFLGGKLYFSYSSSLVLFEKDPKTSICHCINKLNI